MSEPKWEIVYLDDPGERPPGSPARCSRCMTMQNDLKWVHRWPGVPGHFMAVCADEQECVKRGKGRPW